MKRLILFLIRRKLGLKKYQSFIFTNQKDRDDFYYFDDDCLLKFDVKEDKYRPSNVSLNWILSDHCKWYIKKLV